MKRPTFLIIGAARSGSTSLVRSLMLNPGVYMPESESEPKFFSREQEYARGTDYYLATYFADADTYPVVGEKSTEYMENQSSAERIFRFEPEIRLICILRDPVERAVSNYWWSVFNGLETRSIDQAMKEELKSYMENPARIYALQSARPHAYIDRGLYYRNLEPFYCLFPRDKIKCIIFEDFVRNRPAVMRDLLIFLDVRTENPQAAVPSLAPQRAVPKRDTLNPGLYRDLEEFYRTENRWLQDLTGSDARQFWPSA